MIRKLCTYSLGIVGDLTFLYGLLMHGSKLGAIVEVLGFVMMGIAIILVAKSEEQ